MKKPSDTRPEHFDPERWFLEGEPRAYALLHLPEVVRCLPVTKGGGTVHALEESGGIHVFGDLQFPFTDEHFPHRDRLISISEACSLTSIRGLILLRGNRILFEHYSGMRPEQRHHWMSISKSVIHLLLGACVQRGLLDLSRSVADYIPELADCGYGSFSLQELADMNAHVSMNEEDYSDPDSPFRSWARAVGWFPDRGEWPGGVKQLLTEVKRLPPVTGEKANIVFYTGSNTQVLGWAIEKVMGRSLHQVYETWIWQKIGAEQDAFVSVDKAGVPFAGGGWGSTLRDLARFGTIWARKGRTHDGERLFDDSWMEESFSGRGMGVYTDCLYHNHAYSRGQGIMHGGHSGQLLWVNPSTETVVACFGAFPHPNGQNKWSARLQMALAEALDYAALL